MKTPNLRTVAIIGIGPRGSYALENFITELAHNIGIKNIHILLFEATGNFGNGNVYDTAQIESNWINISERILILDKRSKISTERLSIPEFPSYHDWIGVNFETKVKTERDTYPPRAKIGAYLQERFQSFIRPLIEKGLVTLFPEKVNAIHLNKTYTISIESVSKTHEDIAEVLVTIGHQPTELSEELKTWKEFAENRDMATLFTTPYPIAHILQTSKLTFKNNIGIRGFGLAMIDIARALAERFGTFEITDSYSRKCTYTLQTQFAGQFIPFSLDGLPAVPKPLNVLIDEKYKPTTTELENFKNYIGTAEHQKKATGSDFIIRAFAPIAAKIYSKLDRTFSDIQTNEQAIEKVIENWLLDQNFKHPAILSTEMDRVKMMEVCTAMATDTTAISLDFCIGQVWRHCQPTMYEALSFNDFPKEVFRQIIALDESTKRYSYGPPVESIQQLVALHRAGVLNLNFVTNPEIELSETHWQLTSNGKKVAVDLMINSVLDPPKINDVTSPIVKSMLSGNLIQAVHDDLGIMTDENAYVISKDKKHDIPIAVLGRLAKGTIIGVDAILECFGDRPKKWATTAAKRHQKKCTT